MVGRPKMTPYATTKAIGARRFILAILSPREVNVGLAIDFNSRDMRCRYDQQRPPRPSHEAAKERNTGDQRKSLPIGIVSQSGAQASRKLRAPTRRAQAMSLARVSSTAETTVPRYPGRSAT
jgi:hypothetical protein